MTAEKIETNGNTVTEPEKTTATKTPSSRTRKKEPAEVTALSVKGKSGAVHMHDSDTLPNHRPIEDSHLNIVSTFSSVGTDRPITAGEMEISSTLAISGNRPVAVSHLQISDTYTVMGNRPVASNDIDDPAALMGFLD